MIRVKYTLIAIACFSHPALGQEVPPRGFEIVNITRDPAVRHGPRGLNNCGQAIYSARLRPTWAAADIFLYDNGRITRITDNDDRDVFPGITENGLIYWLRGLGEEGVSQLITLADGHEIILAENPDGIVSGVMNAQGHFAWGERLPTGCGGSFIALMFYDGQQTRILRDGGSSPQLTRLNDLDELVWAEFDFCQNPHGIQVYHYSDGVFTEIGEENDRASSPVINNRSQVAYSSQDLDTEWVTKIWEDGNSRVVVDAPRTPPRINNLGDVTFSRLHPAGGEYMQAWMYHDDTEEIAPLTEDEFHQGGWAINDYREVLLSSLEFGQNLQVRLLRRIRTGDSEFDGDIDIDDLAKLVDCMTGPMWVERVNPGPQESLCECRFLDINHDGSVDLRDYALFQENFAKQP